MNTNEKCFFRYLSDRIRLLRQGCYDYNRISYISRIYYQYLILRPINIPVNWSLRRIGFQYFSIYYNTMRQNYCRESEP